MHQEASGGPGTPQEAPGGPKRLQEAPGRSRRHQEVWEVECVKTNMFFYENLRARPFHVDRSDPTLTKFEACAQKLASDLQERRPATFMDSLLGRQNPYRETLFGEYP